MSLRLVMLSLAKLHIFVCQMYVYDKQPETGGLHTVLRLAIRACVMLTDNADVSDVMVIPLPRGMWQLNRNILSGRGVTIL